MRWTKEIKSALQDCDPTTIRDLEAANNRLYISTTITTDHPDNIELRAQEVIHPGEVIAYHFSGLMYATWDLFVDSNTPKSSQCTYGKGILSVSYDIYKYAAVPVIPNGTKTDAFSLFIDMYISITRILITVQ